MALLVISQHNLRYIHMNVTNNTFAMSVLSAALENVTQNITRTKSQNDAVATFLLDDLPDAAKSEVGASRDQIEKDNRRFGLLKKMKSAPSEQFFTLLKIGVVQRAVSVNDAYWLVNQTVNQATRMAVQAIMANRKAEGIINVLNPEGERDEAGFWNGEEARPDAEVIGEVLTRRLTTATPSSATPTRRCLTCTLGGTTPSPAITRSSRWLPRIGMSVACRQATTFAGTAATMACSLRWFATSRR